MFFRLLLLFLIVWFLIWLIRHQFSSNKIYHRKKTSTDAEDMLECTYCGTHIPRSLAVMHDGKPYCCDAHVGLERQA